MFGAEECFSTSPSHLLDNLLQKYEDDIRKECRLINEVKCTLGGNNLYISTGLSPARGFIPIVKLSNNNKNCISFTKYEWCEFEKFEKQIIEHMAERQEKQKFKLRFKRCRDELLKENTNVNTSLTSNAPMNGMKTLSVIDTFKLTFTYTYNLRKNTGFLDPVVKIECRGINLLLDRAAVKAFMNVRLLVNSRLERLELLDFAHYYNSLLTAVCEKKENIEDLKDYIERFLCQFNESDYDTYARIWTSEYTDCVLEIQAFEFNKFKRDIDSTFTRLSVTK